MKVGVDAFTIREISTDPIEQLKYAKKLELDGVQFDEAKFLGTDIKRLHDITSYADENGLYTYASVDVINPLMHGITPQENAAMIKKEIEAYAQVGWHELRTRTGGLEERGAQHRAAAIEVMNLLRSVLKDYGSRINFENHGDCTTFELIRMIEDIGSDIMGINLDIANTMVHAEDPYLAVKRSAPYVHTTHAKDGILYFSSNGIIRQGRPAGCGVVEWEKILPLLYASDNNLPISIEDHKWLFEVRIFNKEWINDHPDLTPYEMGQFVEKAWRCSKKILKGEIQDPDEFEKTPFAEEMLERLSSARDFLKAQIIKL